MKLRLDYFQDFVLNEAKKSTTNSQKGKIKVVLLSNVSEESKTVPNIKAECERRGAKFAVINIDKAKLIKNPDGETFTIYDNESKIKISSDDTAILTRRGVVKSTYTRDIVEQLEEANFFVVNTLESIIACENKYVTSKILMDAGIPVPRMALIDDVDSIDESVKAIGGQFPVVLKMLSGSQGIGVSIVDSIGSLKSVMQTIWKANSNVELLIQEKIDSDYDLRIHVLTKRFNSPTPEDTDSVLIGYMRRNRVKKDFRTNYSLGGSVEKTKITPEQEKIAIESAKAIGCSWCGVDIIVDKKTGKNYVLEVNASPGTEGLKKATGVDVVKDIIDFISDKQNWIRSRKTIGFREVVTIPGIGDIISKFDTGNGALSCSLTYDKAKLADDKKSVDWEINGKKFSNKVIGLSNAEVGHVVQERPIIEMDVIFAGKTYKDVHISLVDRKEKSTKFLVNRKFMERIGCSVSPNKTFVVSSFDGEYSVHDAKGNNHVGIKFEK
jgi:ribosomal protein S6--L-glutamate ligase